MRMPLPVQGPCKVTVARPKVGKAAISLKVGKQVYISFSLHLHRCFEPNSCSPALSCASSVQESRGVRTEATVLPLPHPLGHLPRRRSGQEEHTLQDKSADPSLRMATSPALPPMEMRQNSDNFSSCSWCHKQTWQLASGSQMITKSRSVRNGALDTAVPLGVTGVDTTDWHTVDGTWQTRHSPKGNACKPAVLAFWVHFPWSPMIGLHIPPALASDQ